METNREAELINDTVEGKTIQCPQCGFANKSGSKFCIKCGTKLIVAQNEMQSDIYGSAEEADKNEQSLPFKKAEEAPPEPAAEAFAKGNNSGNEANDEDSKSIKPYIEEKMAFAQGLPEWSLTPPSVLIRRKNG